MPTLLAKRLSSFSPSSFHHHHHHHLALLTPLLRHPFSTQPPELDDIPFLAKYLISSLGFSRDRALKVSADKTVAGIKSKDRPESVVKFLKDTGLSDTQISSVITFRPCLLCCDVEKTMKPKVRELIDAGFSEELLAQLIRYNPPSLQRKNTLSNLLFWRDFVGNCDLNLLKIIPNNGLLIQFDIDKHVVPRVNLLNEYGLSKQDIVKLLGRGYSNIFSRSQDDLRQNLQFIEDLGIPRESAMFLNAFRSLGSYKKEILLKKVEFFKMTYGWSQEEVYSACKKTPVVLSLSVDKIKANMNFLISKAMLLPRSIALHPLLLCYSLEKRLVPRQNVLSILAKKGLKKSCSLSSACNYTEKKFLEMFVEPYKKDWPELSEAYFDVVTENIPA